MAKILPAYCVLTYLYSSLTTEPRIPISSNGFTRSLTSLITPSNHHHLIPSPLLFHAIPIHPNNTYPSPSAHTREVNPSKGTFSPPSLPFCHVFQSNPTVPFPAVANPYKIIGSTIHQVPVAYSGITAPAGPGRQVSFPPHNLSLTPSSDRNGTGRTRHALSFVSFVQKRALGRERPRRHSIEGLLIHRIEQQFVAGKKKLALAPGPGSCSLRL